MCVFNKVVFTLEAARAPRLHSSPTVVVSVQTPECQPQLLLVVLQVLGELVEVETSVFVLVTR